MTNENPFEMFQVPLGTARTKEPINMAGSFLYFTRAYDSGTNDRAAEIEIVFDINGKLTPARLIPGQGIRTPFKKFFITNAAFSGITAELFIGKDVEIGVNRLNVPERPSNKIGRTQRILTGEALTASTVLGTVTSGKRFFLDSVLFTAYNIDATTAAFLRINDSATTKFSVGIPPAIAGITVPQCVVALSYREPPIFSTNMSYEEVTGVAVASMVLIGYEE